MKERSGMSVGEDVTFVKKSIIVNVEEHAGVLYYDVKFYTAHSRERIRELFRILTEESTNAEQEAPTNH